MRVIGGADEAGRGPILGPLVICAAIFNEQDIPYLQDQGVHDSKKLSAKKRDQLLEIIQEKVIDYELVIIKACHIDKSLNSGTNLNALEVLGFARAINNLLNRNCNKHNVHILHLDAADVKPKRFQTNIQKKLQLNVTLNAEHKADENILVVGAASIIAKTTRDKIIKQLQAENGDIGSGYPSDLKTRNFLKDYYQAHKKFPSFARHCWSTIKKIEKELGVLPKGQKTLF